MVARQRILQPLTKAQSIPWARPNLSRHLSSTSKTSGSRSSTEGAQSDALRTAEARESALRAARLRRQQQHQFDKAAEEDKSREKKEYETRYKSAARRWVSGIIAMPILLVTSYYLFDRLALGHEPKELSKFRSTEST